MSKKAGSMRDQIEHWRKRALTAEQANARAAQWVEEERQSAKKVVSENARILYMAGADAAGLRIALGKVVEGLKKGELRVGLWNKGNGKLVEELEAALSGEAGARFIAEGEVRDAKIEALASFADKVDDLLEGLDLSDEVSELAKIDGLLDELAKKVGAKRSKDGGASSEEGAEVVPIESARGESGEGSGAEGEA